MRHLLRHISNCEAVLVFGGWVMYQNIHFFLFLTCERLMRTFWWYKLHYEIWKSCRKWRLTVTTNKMKICQIKSIRNTQNFIEFLCLLKGILCWYLIKLETGDWVSFNSYGDILTFQTLYEKTFAESSFLSTLPLGILIPYQGKSFWELPPNRMDSIKIGVFLNGVILNYFSNKNIGSKK